MFRKITSVIMTSPITLCLKLLLVNKVNNSGFAIATYGDFFCESYFPSSFRQIHFPKAMSGCGYEKSPLNQEKRLFGLYSGVQAQLNPSRTFTAAQQSICQVK
jgi:hypothetical protein